MRLLTKSNDASTDLGVVERLAYMSGNTGVTFLNVIIGAFLMFYYTDVLFLNPAVIGTIILVSRIFDGVTDLAMGLIVDRTHSKYGRCRIWILRMCVPYALSGILMMLVPTGATTTIQYIYVFITYNLCNSICLTALYVPYNALISNITNNVVERGYLSIFATFGSIAATLIIQSTIDSVTKALGGGARAWQIATAGYALLGLIFCLICFFFTKERCTAVNEKAGEKPKVDFKLEMKSLFGNKYWIMVVAVVFIGFLNTNLANGCGMYYAKAILGDTAHYASFANAMSIAQMVTICISFIFVKKLGKRTMMLLSFTVQIISTVLLGIMPGSVTAAVIFSALRGFGGGLSGAIIYAVIADAIDYGEWKYGQKAEGAGMAAMSFAIKVGQGLSTVMLGALMSWSGYDAAAAVQSSRATFALNAGFNFIPAAFCLIAFFIMLKYDLDKIYPTIQKELAERRQQNAAL